MLNIPIEVQDALREGALRKNYKMKVNDVDPDTGERTYLYTIDNDTLVSESVKIDERMVTGKVLKFGLCEGSSLEFQYFDHPNINGKDVQVYCSVEYVDGNGDVAWYDIPMGWYSVDQCPMQWETGIYKVTAYNKLKSSYLDKKANNLAIEGFSSSNVSLSMYDIRRLLLSDFEIEIDKSEGYSPYSPSGSFPTTDTTIGTNYRFSALYGIDSPYSSKMYQEDVGSMPTLSTNLEFHIVSNRFDYSVTNTFEIDYLAGKLYELEQNFKQYIIDLFDSAQLKQNGNAVSGQDIIDSICANTNFFNVFGISALGKGDGTYSKPFSTIQWEYEERKGITHTVETIYDCVNRTWKSGMYINLPSYIFSPVFDDLYDFQNVRTYRYYEDSGYTDVVEKEYPAMLNPDGSAYSSYYFRQNYFKVYNISDALTDADLIEVQPSSVPEFTLREIVAAVYEIDALYGKLDRETDLFAGVELNQGGLYPADTLYPDNALYPSGNMEHPFPSTYSKLWTDTVGEQSFRYLIITYKGTENGQEVEKKLQRTVNADGTTDYDMSDNWLFRNLVWSDADVGDYADAMVLKMKDIRWFPFEMWCAGLPYVETGDAIEITDKQGNTHTSYVLTRTLDGIHNLQDTFINGELDIF